MKNDKYYMTRAFKLANNGRFTTSPNPNVGCVIVLNNSIVGEGSHKKIGEPHAEINALKMAGKKANGSTIYVTLEPCNHYGITPPCTEAIIKAGIIKVVAAMYDPNPKVCGEGFKKLKQAGIIVSHGLMLEQAEILNQGFLKRMRTGFPFIRIKIAASLDGRTAMCSGESKWITSFESRKDVQKFRAESDVILSTSSTIIADNPMLTVRWSLLPNKIKKIYPEEKIRQPIRVILDRNNKLKKNYKIFNDGKTTWLFKLFPDTNQLYSDNIKQFSLPLKMNCKKQYFDLKILMKKLGLYKINNVLVESGSKLAGSLLSEGLVDEILVYQAYKLLGSNAKPLFFLPNLVYIKDAPTFDVLEIKRIGIDLRIRLKPILKI